MLDRLILFGAGSCGRYVLAHLATKGITPVAFADNASEKWGKPVDGVPVMSPTVAKLFAPDATFVATCISAPAREIRAEIKVLGVRTIPLHDVLPCHHGQPPDSAYRTIERLIANTDDYDPSDDETRSEWFYQCAFRKQPDYDAQSLPESCADIYFPDFITHLDEEVFWDCGACAGDTVESFLSHWGKFKQILAIEPDAGTFEKLKESVQPVAGDILVRCSAVGDHNGVVPFICNGDFSSHIDLHDSTGLRRNTVLDKLDDIEMGWWDSGQEWVAAHPPTYIKADIEGSELEALWGARKIIKEHAPVLAICAYHTSDHLWQIPLLIHALNPDYKLFLRRYAEATFELVWYAVPPERVK